MVSERTWRLAESVHVQPAADDSAVVVDDRTLTAATVNPSARAVLDALRVPRTEQQLVSVLTGIGFDEVVAVAATTRLLAELTGHGWVETGTAGPLPHD